MSAPESKALARKVRKPQPTFYFYRAVKTYPDAFKSGGSKKSEFLKPEDDILWPYKVGDEGKLTPVPITEAIDLAKADVQWMPRKIRFIYGMQTIFVDEQEPQGRQLPQNSLENYLNREQLILIDGELRVPSTDRVRQWYLQCSNQCENQHPKARRYGNTKVIYRLLDFAYDEEQKVEKGKLKEQAFKMAQTARLEEMVPHAKYLGIPFVIAETDEVRDFEAIREDYKDFAYMNPDRFIDSFTDPRVKIIYAISKLVERGEINIAGGTAKWTRSQEIIASIPPDQQPVEFLAEFTLTKDGETLASMLRTYDIING